MPWRLAFGRSTNARARLEALLRVIDWLTCALTAAGWRSSLFWTGGSLQSRPASGFGDDGRGASGVSGDGRGGCVRRLLCPGARRRQAFSPALRPVWGDDGWAYFSFRYTFAPS